MNGINIFGLTLLALVLMFIMLRVERRAVWLVLLLLVAPAIVAVARWASVGEHWGELALALAMAVPLTVAWWIIIGRRMPRPNSDNIKVWGQEKVPTPKPAEARALKTEVVELREQNERLEAELRHLRSGHNGDRPPEAK